MLREYKSNWMLTRMTVMENTRLPRTESLESS